MQETVELISENKQNKANKVIALIEASTELVEKVDADVAKCKVGISKAAEEFDLAKRTFKNVSLKKADSLLEKVGFEYITFDEAEKFDLSIDSLDNEHFSVKKLSSGKFTGFILAILAGLLVVGAWIYVALLKLNINPNSLNIETATTQVKPILTWVGENVISGNNAMIVGAVILGLSAFFIAGLVYLLRISMRASKNLRIAEKTFEQSNEYFSAQENCQQKMQKIDNHLRDVTSEIGNLEMILNEQTSALKRIIHVEGREEDEKEYHPSSKKVMRETEKIMRATEYLIETAITEDNELNFKSVQALNSAKDTYSAYLSRIYD